MKGIVFSVKRTQQKHLSTSFFKRLRFVSFKQFLSHYGIQSMFLVLFFIGVVTGSMCFNSIDKDALLKLDFLFLSNLENRFELSAIDLFFSSFASGFIFIFVSFLLSFTAWGMFALPVLCASFGICTGISSAYIFSQYQITGIGFYILVVLPGTVLFLFAFILSLKEALSQSILLLRSYFSTTYDGLLLKRTKTYLFRNCIILIFSVISSVVDMLLFLLFSDMFKF